MDKTRFTLDFRIIDGDVDLPNNSFRTTDFTPQGCFCIYSNHQSLEYIRQSLEKTLLSDLEDSQEDRLPFHGLPIVIIFAANSNVNEKELIYHREEGQNLAKSLQCPFLDVTNFDQLEQSQSNQIELNQVPMIPNRFDSESLNQALRALIESIQRRAGLIQIYQSTLPEQALNPDLRVLMLLHCGDPFSLDQVMVPFFNHHCCYVTSSNSFSLEFFMNIASGNNGNTQNEQNKKTYYVEFICTSYHGAQSYRDELLHGFLLFYSSKRKASLATLSSFTTNIPNTPIQIVAISENSNSNISNNSNIYYSNHDLNLQLLSEGNGLADKLRAHFVTLTTPVQQKASFLTPFLNEVLERKSEIEKRYDMDDSADEFSLEHQTPIPPPVPSRQESYHVRSGSVEDNADSDGIYEQLPNEKSERENCDIVSSSGFVDGAPLSPSDDSEIYAGVFSTQENGGGEHLVKPSQIKNRRSLQASKSLVNYFCYFICFILSHVFLLFLFSYLISLLPHFHSDLYQQSFPSSESLDSSSRPLPSRPRENKTPLQPPRRDLGFAPPPYTSSSSSRTHTASPPPSYVSHFSPRLPQHQHHHRAAAYGLPSQAQLPSVYATGRRRTHNHGDHHGYSDVKSYTPFHYHFHLKKSSSQKPSGIHHQRNASSLTQSGNNQVSVSNQLPDDFDASDDITDEDDEDDTVSSGLSGEYYMK